MQNIDYRVDIIRTNRKKTASISIDDQVIKLYVPRKISEGKINEILDTKKPWIISKIKEKSLLLPKRYVSGELFSYLGYRYRLKVSVGRRNSIKLKRGYFNISILESDSDQEIKKILFTWYVDKAKIFLTKKTYTVCKKLGVMPKSIIIKDYKSKWGSCSINGDIRYNWRIIMAPKKVIDYLITHELCHLLEHNHSQNFWRLVAKYCSHMEQSRSWLKKFGNDLIKL